MTVGVRQDSPERFEPSVDTLHPASLVAVGDFTTNATVLLTNPLPVDNIVGRVGVLFNVGEGLLSEGENR